MSRGAETGAYTREEGARIAGEELADPVYGEAEPSLFDRIIAALQDLAERILAGAAEGMPGGWWTLAPLLAVLALGAVALVVRARPSRKGTAAGSLFGGTAVLTAADHRSRADEAAARGDHTGAVRERLRAIALDLEERAVIAPRAGRTATELAADAGALLPAQADALTRAAAVFNDAVYGDRPASEADARTLAELDTALQGAAR